MTHKIHADLNIRAKTNQQIIQHNRLKRYSSSRTALFVVFFVQQQQQF